MRSLLLLALLLSAPAWAQRPAIALDGTITEARWQLLGTSAGGPAPGFGAGHEINALYMHRDGLDLYVGVAGNVQDGNRILVFLDTRAGGRPNGDFGRAGAPAGINNFNSATTFDPGFVPDYCLVIGTNSGQTNYFVDLYTLSGVAGTGGGPNLVIGDTADPDVGASPANGSTTRGFEVRLTTSTDGAGADLALSRDYVFAFAAYTGDSGFLSNQFVSPAGSGDGNYGGGAVTFGAAAPDPVALVTADPAEVARYRLLGSPVIGQTVGDLARLNLVQGVTGQYPAAAANLYTGWTGSGYTAPVGTADVLAPGRGFWWQLYDADINPDPASFGGGTSRSYALTATYRLEAGGRHRRTTQTASFADNASDFYMIANPFAQPFVLGSLTASGGTLSNFVQAWDPAQAPSGGYVLIDKTSGAAAAPWQGYFAEVTGTDPVEFTFAAAGISPDAAPTFFGRETVAQGLQLVLAGTLASGEAVGDEAAHVRLSATAAAGWDAEDASKLVPPTDAYALVAPVALREGEARRSAVTSLPPAGEALAVPVAFTATGAGTFTLAARAALPAGWRAELRDLVTGAVADLAAGQALAFESAATGWAERFELHLVPAGVVAADAAPEASARLRAARPNPARGSAEAVLELAAPQHVRAVLVDALGREVRVLHDAPAAAGPLALRADVRGLAPGVYLLRATTPAGVATQTLTVVR